MHALVRHLAARIWATVALGGLLSLWLLPLLQAQLGVQWLVALAAAIGVVCFFVIGRLFHLWGESRVAALIRAAGQFERDGLVTEAQDCYRRAVAVLDSFLMSPRARRKSAPPLALRLARFHVARADEAAARSFIPAYLMHQPEDREVAEFWVQRAEQRGGLKEADQELAARIGAAHPENPRIQSSLARFFMFLERADYTALQAYRSVWSHQPPPAFIRELARLFLRDRRVDEWALEVYLAARSAGFEHGGLLEALAACVHFNADSASAREHVAEARKALEGLTEVDIEAFGEEFRPAAPVSVRSRRAAGRHPIRRIRQVAARASAAFAAAGSAASERMRRQFRAFRGSATARRLAAFGLLTILLAAVGVFSLSTLRHLTKPPVPPASENIQPPPPEVTDPFTLQVAAYLRPDYAKQYVAELKEKGLEAYWSEAVSGSKKWYQVRISHFATKQAALAMGESLKARGIIDDFYVANYRAANTE